MLAHRAAPSPSAPRSRCCTCSRRCLRGLRRAASARGGPRCLRRRRGAGCTCLDALCAHCAYRLAPGMVVVHRRLAASIPTASSPSLSSNFSSSSSPSLLFIVVWHRCHRRRARAARTPLAPAWARARHSSRSSPSRRLCRTRVGRALRRCHRQPQSTTARRSPRRRRRRRRVIRHENGRRGRRRARTPACSLAPSRARSSLGY